MGKKYTKSSEAASKVSVALQFKMKKLRRSMRRIFGFYLDSLRAKKLTCAAHVCMLEPCRRWCKFETCRTPCATSSKHVHERGDELIRISSSGEATARCGNAPACRNGSTARGTARPIPARRVRRRIACARVRMLDDCPRRSVVVELLTNGDWAESIRNNVARRSDWWDPHLLDIEVASTSRIGAPRPTPAIHIARSISFGAGDTSPSATLTPYYYRGSGKTAADSPATTLPTLLWLKPHRLQGKCEIE